MFQLRVARLTKPHGLKGGIKLELYTDDPEHRFVRGASFDLKVPADSPWAGRQITLNELRWYNGHPVAFFDEIPDRTVAESIVKAILLVDKDEKELPAEPDAWYDHQLAGLHVLRDGADIGVVTRVEHLPAQDLLVIESDDREVLMPFVAQFVGAVDIAAGTIVVTPPDGLFEDLPDSDE